MPLPSQNRKIGFLILTIILGLVIVWPSIDFQPLLSQGDHGRDLYAFKKTLDGALPYRDYWWVYGPLMQYYYALFYLLFGISIKSVLIGKTILGVLCAAAFYLTFNLVSAPLWAFLASLWFLTFFPDFFFTYNHT